MDLERLSAAVSKLGKVLRMAKSEFFVNHLSAIDPNQDHGFALWKSTRNLKRQPLYRFCLKRSDGTWSHSDSEIAEVFADDLANRFILFDFATIQEDRNTISRFELSFGPPVAMRPVDPWSEEVRVHIRRLAPTKASGMDRIDNKDTKSLPNSVVAQLCLHFNASLSLGHFPSPWKANKSSVHVFQGFLSSWILTRLMTLYQNINLVSVVATQLLKRFTES